jgi:ABC-type multidrug transport system fused ATPase/permease subunit
LTFKLVPARHRLGLIDDPIRERIVAARRPFAEHLPEELHDEIAFFDFDNFTAGATIQDNILFGKVAYGQANAVSQVGALVGEVLDATGLRDTVMLVGLDSETGSGGSRLSAAQRQKLVIARAVIKRPKVLLIHDATVALDASAQSMILDNLLSECSDTTFVWTAGGAEQAEKFENVAVLEGGRVVEQGKIEELLNNSDSKLARMGSRETSIPA